MKDHRKNSGWRGTRQLLNTVHLWLGVGSGVILFVVCLTGTVYTFSDEIKKLTDSHLYRIDVPVAATPIPAEELIIGVLDSLQGGIVQSVTIPSALNASYQITIGQPQGDNGPGRPRGTTYFVNPYTGDILGTGETTTSEFFMVMFRLHRWLLLDTSIGRPIVGVATIIFVVIIITGLVIWFPKKIKNWKQGVKIKTNANWKRMNHDLHNALGFYASLFLLVMALTGLTWSFEWYKKGFVNTFATSSDVKPPELRSTFIPNSKRLPVTSFISAAKNILPYDGDHRVNLTADSTGVVVVMKTGNGFFATSVADRVTLDQYSAQVLATDLFASKPFGDQVVASIKAIHIGSFAGLFSKILYFITCLTGTSLPVTGVIIWINKLRRKDDKKITKNRRSEVRTRVAD